MLTSHPIHVLSTGSLFLERYALLSHALCLSLTCDDLRTTYHMIDYMEEASRSEAEAREQQIALGAWLNEPLASGHPAFERRLASSIWHVRRRREPREPSLFVVAETQRQNNEWLKLRIMQCLRGFGYCIGFTYRLILLTPLWWCFN